MCTPAGVHEYLAHEKQPLPRIPDFSFGRGLEFSVYRGTSLIRNNHSLGPYSRALGMFLQSGHRKWLFLMSEVPL